MKVIALTLLVFCLYSISLYSQQEAIINDKDGYTNVRSDTSINSKVIGKIYEDEVFWTFKLYGDWYKVFFFQRADTPSSKLYEINLDGSLSAEGYIHKSRVNNLDDYEILGLDSTSKNTCHLSSKNYRLTSNFQKFNPEENSIDTFFTKNGYPIISAINKDYIWGTDGGMPRTEFKSVTFSYLDYTIELPQHSLSNFYDPWTKKGYLVYKEGETYFVRFIASDGAGFYTAIWVFKYGKYQSRYAFTGY